MNLCSSVHFYIEILPEDGHNGCNIKQNFVETGWFLQCINCFDCNCLLNVLAEQVRCLSVCDLCC